LDNGLTVGARVELEGEQKSGDQIDAAFVYFQGGFGELRIGSQNSALAAMCVTPVGGSANFGAFSQSSINNNAFAQTFAGSATVCEGVDSENFSGERQEPEDRLLDADLRRLPARPVLVAERQP
jgi:hypothetical protein